MADLYTQRLAERIVREGVDATYLVLENMQGQIIEQSRARQQMAALVRELVQWFGNPGQGHDCKEPTSEEWNHEQQLLERARKAVGE
jgi:hypothetical protein